MIRKGLNLVFELAFTAGVVLLLFVAYEAWFTNIASDHKQDHVASTLRDQWGSTSSPAQDPALGDGIAFIHIPRFGEDWDRAILEGVNPDELDAGPGHYPGSAMPGQIGNFSLAGHRVGLGSPFLDADKLQAGDPIVIETADTWFVYRVTSNEIVKPSHSEVVNPVPDAAANVVPTKAFITLTTCNPKFSARQRLVVHGVLDSQVSKKQLPNGPRALQEVS